MESLPCGGGVDPQHRSRIRHRQLFPRDEAQDLSVGGAQASQGGENATRVDSVDVSSYEKATILHDMNLPIPGEPKERFTLVHDAGVSNTSSTCRRRSRTAWRWCAWAATSHK